MLSIECGSKRLEFYFKNTIPLHLIFLYQGFEDAYSNDLISALSLFSTSPQPSLFAESVHIFFKKIEYICAISV